MEVDDVNQLEQIVAMNLPFVFCRSGLGVSSWKKKLTVTKMTTPEIYTTEKQTQLKIY